MGNVLNFPVKQIKDKELLRLKGASDRIDRVVAEAITQDGLEPYEMAGILAHRLGALIKSLDGNSTLLGVCEKVIKKKAGATEGE